MTLEQAKQASDILQKIGKLETAIRNVKASTFINFHGELTPVHIDETNTFERDKIITISILTQKLNDLEQQIKFL